jgi:hypothetical protein
VNKTVFKWRLVILVELGLFCLSVSLLLWAGTAPARIPAGQVTWPGMVDVLSAFAVILIGILIYSKGHKLVDGPVWNTYFVLATLLPTVTFALLFVFVDRIRWWDVLLPGLAWRMYILLQTLPAAIATWKSKSI